MSDNKISVTPVGVVTTNETVINQKTEELSTAAVAADVLPETSKSFSFCGQDFADESFSIDLFLKRNRSKVTLEQLKDDLSSYLKVLKTSMIELINEDYNDFINLSTNLMGFDKAINNLSQPLVQLRDQSAKIEEQFSERITQLESLRQRLQCIRLNKNQLNKLISITKDIETADKWFIDYINCVHNSDDNHRMNMSSLEKIALLVMKIEIQLKAIDLNIPLIRNQLIPRITTLSNDLKSRLESGFFSAIANVDQQELNSIVRIYSLNGKQTELETIFRQKVVKPYMNEIICETFLQKYGIKQFFDEIIEFIDLKCELIVALNETNGSFMINSVWSEICNCLVVRTPSLFSVGNPDVFHRHYCLTTDFIDRFIEKSFITRNDLIRDNHYKELMNKFNVEVYYHIRYQQMATKFELSLEDKAFKLNPMQNSSFKYLSTQTLYECLTTSWSKENIYISVLFPSFWKLTIQLISRYTYWLQNITETDLKIISTTNDISNNRLSTKIVLLGTLINDCKAFAMQSKLFYKQNILDIKPTIVSSDELEKSFDDMIDILESKGLSNVITLIELSLIEQCNQILKQVNDLPRLYRKTNKEVPTKASNYISNCIDLMTSITSNKEQVWSIEWTRHVLNETTTNFKQFTSEVLTSVQKIEDSLKRLKKLKIGNQSNQLKNNLNNMSDDDKIRLQIYYDVQEYGKQIEEKLKIDCKSIKSFNELFDMTNASKNLIN
ncbi:conserved oligomeric Golgi complex subunit 2-like [Oppia nitens]|uniref:conserved oligomeric Golgi complex subunit 2-like n=1 Tax=Oppia nitens TaxID=1686743 RepID=UPI0023DAD9FD|nr:conserved oligomeric Golgi complex subunit 2-like [Oppia nitens]